MGEGRFWYTPLYMDSLAKLFGSPARLKLLRLFFFNEELSFTAAVAATRAKVSLALARKEIAALVSAGIFKKRASGFTVDKRFEHHEALFAFLRGTTALKDGVILDILKRAGSLRLVVLSGLFSGTIETKVDVLVVGDRLDDRALTLAIQKLEAELGRELRYASFSTEDFRYRRGVYDRLIRDVFDYPRRVILDKIGV